MSIKIHKCCGNLPEYIHYQAGWDICEGYFRCNICGKEGDRAEHVWGGEEMMALAAYCWNELFEEV